ncbi:hypothetical protein C8T65DRAFT_697104 [Cerioporus squamosus]|nr:hypothetical protein C8T65DRAFT_697104 [Cerioporus squamosus]
MAAGADGIAPRDRLCELREAEVRTWELLYLPASEFVSVFREINRATETSSRCVVTTGRQDAEYGPAICDLREAAPDGMLSIRDGAESVSGEFEPEAAAERVLSRGHGLRRLRGFTSLMMRGRSPAVVQ